MQTPAQTRLAGILSALLLVIGLTRHAAAIVADNDVSGELSNCLTVDACNLTTGPPRLVGSGDNFKISLDLGSDSFSGRVSYLELIFYDENLEEQCVASVATHGNPCRGFLRLSHEELCVGNVDPHGNPCHGFRGNHLPGGTMSLTLSNFSITGLPFGKTDRLIVAVQGHLAITTETRPPGPVITISGGEPVIVDRVGDLDPCDSGGILDIPARSVQLAQALNQLPKPLELDSWITDCGRTPQAGQVGWTHVFPLHQGNIKNAKITVELLTTPRCQSDGYIRLGTGVGTDRVTVIFLDDLLPHPCDDQFGPPLGPPRHVVLDLTKAPVRRGRTQPFELVPLLDYLEEGRLNVIVNGDNGVNYSVLTITLNEN
jgi:hypothetical protein